jgi:hypothetical protein
MSYGRNGPYQYVYPQLRKNPELMRYLQAIGIKKGQSLASVIEDCCAEVFAPDLSKNAPAEQFFVSSTYRAERNVTEVNVLMARLRGIKNQRRAAGERCTLGRLIEEACLLWIDRRVWKIDQFGAAKFGDGFLAERARVFATMRVDYPDFELPWPSAPPPAGLESWGAATGAQLARALEAEFVIAPQFDNDSPFRVD